jgi:predicted alpha/beta-hydrolase family hydrolase
MQMLYQRFVERDYSVVLMEYPYQTNGGQPPENDLSEEINALKVVVDELKKKGYQRFTYVCKSLGGLVATWLMREPEYTENCENIHLLGCVLPRGDEEGIDAVSAREKIRLVIQGELDEYGNVESVRNYLKTAGCDAEVIEIKDGDHSYRHLGSRELPTHEAEAVEALFAHFDK